MKFFTFSCLFFIVGVKIGESLRCYTCSYDEKDSQEAYLCVTEPWNITGYPIRTCLPHINYCIIIRVENKITDKVTSFLRKCEENPMKDSDIDSSTIVTHYRSCTDNLCNKGDGLDYLDEGYDGDSTAILVPDKKSKGFMIHNFVGLLLISMTYLFVFK